MNMSSSDTHLNNRASENTHSHGTHLDLTPIQQGSHRGNHPGRVFITDPPVEPEGFFQIINRMSMETQRLYSLIAAHEIRLFDILETPRGIDEILTIYPRHEMIRSLLQVLVDLRYIRESEGRYVNTPVTSTYFSSFSPFYQGAYLGKIHRRIHDLWAFLPEMIQNGPVEYDKEAFFCKMCLPPMAENALTGRLQQVTRSIVALPEFLSSRRMLDLGGGHGLYAIALASLNRDLRCIVFDLPEVVDTTCDYIIAHEMDKQVKVLPGDFFRDEIGSGYDIILSSSNPSGKNPEFVKKILDALRPGGIFVNIQAGDSDIRYDPLSQLESRMWVLKGEPEWKTHRGKKQPFSSETYLSALKEAGLEIIQTGTIPDLCHDNYSVTMLICKKPEKPRSDPILRISVGMPGEVTRIVSLVSERDKPDWLKTCIRYQLSPCSGL